MTLCSHQFSGKLAVSNNVSQLQCWVVNNKMQFFKIILKGQNVINQLQPPTFKVYIYLPPPTFKLPNVYKRS